MVLFDTNLLVYAHVTSSPFHEAARRLRDEAVEGALDACISPQVLCEFFAVCTNPRLFRPPLTVQQAGREVVAYWTASGFRKILPQESTVRRLVGLVEQHRLQGQRIFDAFLVATMLDNNVTTLYTLNTKDFEVYTELRVVNPLVRAPSRP